MPNKIERVVSGLELWQWRAQAKAAAIKAGISPKEVDWLLQEITPLEPLALRLESFKEQSQIELHLPLKDLNKLWQQRIEERVPLQYLIGRARWRNFSLAVSPAVLIPRPETELIIDLAVEACKNNPSLAVGDWADLGTGSGALAFGLADALTKTTIHAVDISAEALALARQNAYQLGLTERIKFYQGSWFYPLKALKGQLSGIVSNPPYIPDEIVPHLMPEVAKHEPHLALAGGADGLDCIREIITFAPIYLRPGGILILEMMIGQAETVAKLLNATGKYSQIQISRDLAGIERFALAHKIL